MEGDIALEPDCVKSAEIMKIRPFTKKRECPRLHHQKIAEAPQNVHVRASVYWALT